MIGGNCTEKAMELFYKGVLPDGTEVRDYMNKKGFIVSVIPRNNIKEAQKLFHNKATNLADFEAAMEKERAKYEGKAFLLQLWHSSLRKDIETISGLAADSPASGAPAARH